MIGTIQIEDEGVGELQNINLPFPELRNRKSEAPRPQGGASRKGNIIYIVPLDPAYKAGLARHLPVT